MTQWCIRSRPMIPRYSRDAVVQEGLRQPFPRTLAAQLERQFGRLNDIALEIIRVELAPAIAQNDPIAIEIALDRVQAAIDNAYSDDTIAEESRAMAERVNKNHSKRFFAAVGTAIGVKILGSDSPKRGAGLAGAGAGGGMPPTPGFAGFVPPEGPRQAILGVKVNVAPEIFADDFANKNVMLIGEMRKGIRAGLSDAIVRARMEDLPSDEVARRLLLHWEQKGIPAQLPTKRVTKQGKPVMISTSKHAKLVAHDQISKLNAQLNQTRQQAAGIERFRWVTMGDNRVRPAHRALNGRIFSWDAGAPGEGLPGESVACRCHAAAIVDKGQILEKGNFVPL